MSKFFNTLGELNRYGEPEYRLSTLNVWGNHSGCNHYNGGIGQKKIFKKVTSEYEEYFNLIEKYKWIGVKVFLNLSKGSTAYFVSIPKIIYFKGDIIKAATIETPYGDKKPKDVTKIDKKWLYNSGLKNKDRLPVPDDLPFKLDN